MYDRRRTPTELCTRCPAAVAGGAELRDERVLSVPGAGPGADVEDDRLADPDAQLEMALEIRQLEGDRREDAVVVEAGLADRDDPRIARQGDDLRPVAFAGVRRFMGMDPNGGGEPREPLDEPERAPRRLEVPARYQDPLDALAPGRLDDVRDVIVEPVGLQMTVAIDEAHRRIVGRRMCGR